MKKEIDRDLLKAIIDEVGKSDWKSTAKIWKYRCRQGQGQSQHSTDDMNMFVSHYLLMAKIAVNVIRAPLEDKLALSIQAARDNRKSKKSGNDAIYRMSITCFQN